MTQIHVCCGCDSCAAIDPVGARIKALESRCERYREALERIADSGVEGSMVCGWMADFARSTISDTQDKKGES